MTSAHTMPPSRWQRQRRLAALAAVGALSLALVACGGDDDDETSTAEGSGGDSGGQTVEITTPADGDTVQPDFDLQLQSSEELGEPDTGRRHIHVYVDGNEDDYEIAYQDSLTLERNLSAGEHTIEAQLANPDHSPVEGVEDEITVTVGGDGGGAGAGGSGDGGSSTTTSEDDDGGYDY